MSSPPAPSTVSEESPQVALGVTNARRWTIVWLLFTASLINYFDRQTLSYALPLLAKDFHLDKALQGLVVSAFFWTYTTLQIPIGLCADRMNLRWLYAGAFALWSLAQGLTGFAGSVVMLLGCRMLLGVGESIYLVGGTKVVSLLFPLSQRGLPCGLFDAGTRTGLGIGRADDWLAVADFRLANHVHHRRVRRAGVVGALVPGNPGANARHVGGRRAHSNYLGPIRDPVAQPRFVGGVARLLLF